MAPSTLKSQQLFSDAIRLAHLSHGRNPIELLEQFLRDTRAQLGSAPALRSLFLITLPDRFLLIEATDVIVHLIDKGGYQFLPLPGETGITSLRLRENERKPALHFARQHS
jgi:hypothetical protein